MLVRFQQGLLDIQPFRLMVKTPVFDTGDIGPIPMKAAVAIEQWLVRQIVALHIRVRFPVVTPRVGRIVAIAADCKSADFGLRQFESGPAHSCLRVRVGLRYHPAKVVCINCTEGSNPSANAIELSVK